MALYTTNPQETINVAEAAASRVPTVELTGPVDGATNVSPRAPINLFFGAGELTLPIVTVNGVIVYRGTAPRLGWHAQSRASGEGLSLILTPPVGFSYRSVVIVEVDFEPEAGVNDDAVVIPA